MRAVGSHSVGIQCALCHSIVDDSFTPGIGRRLDGWANRDLNIGAIVALAPRLRAGRRRCSASMSQRCAPCWKSGDRESSTPSCCWTARRFGPTAGQPRR